MRRGQIATRIVLSLLLLFSIAVVTSNALLYDKQQWDFRSYYYAAVADESGANPYDRTDLQRAAGDGHGVLPYVYPPPTLTIFKLFTLMPYDVAVRVWLAVKLLLLAGLILIWRRVLFPTMSAPVFYTVLLLAFGATINVDLMAGNVSLLEQALLWAGFVWLLRGRVFLFSLCVLLASLFKLTPLLFLLLLPIHQGRRGWKYLAGTVVVLAGLGLVSYAADTGSYARFLAAVTTINESGMFSNPSLLALWSDLRTITASSIQVPLPQALSLWLYVISAACILACGGFYYRRARSIPSSDRDRWILFLYCLTYALVLPRFKTYSFILLIPPALYVIQQSARLPATVFVVIILALASTSGLPINPLLQVLWWHYPLALTFMLWVLLLRGIRNSEEILPGKERPVMAEI